MHKILQTYQSKYGLTSIETMISKWAPAKENNTEAYIKDVDDRVAGTRDSPIALFDATVAYDLLTAIIAHENANYAYDPEVIWKALMLAGVPVEQA